MMRYASYARLVAMPVKGLIAPVPQQEVIRRYAYQNGGTIAAEYLDIGMSGQTLNRVQLQKMMRQASEGIYDGVLVHRFDHLGSERAREEIIPFFLKLGIAIISCSEGWYWDPKATACNRAAVPAVNLLGETRQAPAGAG